MNNGRATLPDALNARAETAQAVFDLESADGDEKIARVKLTEAVGAEPSPNITIDGEKDTPLPQTLTLSIDSLIDRALANRPDLQAKAAEIRAADDTIRQARPGSPLFTLIDTRNWWVIANYRESKLREIRPGMHVDVYLMGHPNHRFNGVVESIGYGVFPEDGTVTNGLPNIERTLNWVHRPRDFLFVFACRIPTPRSSAWVRRPSPW